MFNKVKKRIFNGLVVSTRDSNVKNMYGNVESIKKVTKDLKDAI